MRRTFGPHAPVNMAESMENDGSSTVSGSKETVEVPEELQLICENLAYQI